jgi:hypothetical protein
MIRLFLDLLTGFSAVFRSRYKLSLKILALRQQVSVLKRKQAPPVASPVEFLDSAPPRCRALRGCKVERQLQEAGCAGSKRVGWGGRKPKLSAAALQRIQQRIVRC